MAPELGRRCCIHTTLDQDKMCQVSIVRSFRTKVVFHQSLFEQQSAEAENSPHTSYLHSPNHAGIADQADIGGSLSLSRHNQHLSHFLPEYHHYMLLVAKESAQV